MNCSMARRVLILLWGTGAGLYPLSSLALGLGELQVESRLNQPLRARIEVSDVSDEEWRVLRAHLSRQTSQADGLSRPGLLESVTFKNVEDENHRRFIVLRSVEVFTEPLFDLSVDVSGASLQVTRNYTVFLDPPRPNDDLPGARGPALVSQPAAPVKRDVGVAARGGSSVAVQAGPSAVAGNTSNASYTVTKSDTLGRIARRFGGPTAANRNQFMDWVFQHNPAAFYGDMNRLRAGARLALPENAAVAAAGSDSAAGAGAAGAHAAGTTHAATPGVGTPPAVGTSAADKTPPAAMARGIPTGDSLADRSVSGGEAAKVQLQGELTHLQQELTGLQKMIAQQDAQIASLKQQLLAREETQRLAQASRAPAEDSQTPGARAERSAQTQPSAQPKGRSSAHTSNDQTDAARSTAALAHADQNGVLPPEDQNPPSASAERSSAAPSAAGSSRAAASNAIEPSPAASGTDQKSSWSRYHLKTSVYYWMAAVVALATLVVWFLFYIRRRMDETNPVVDLRYPIGPSFERTSDAPGARTSLTETLPIGRSPGSASAASKLSAALKRAKPEESGEADAEAGHEVVPEGPQSGMDDWRTQTALLEQDILSETDMLPFAFDTQDLSKPLERELLLPSELTRESQEIVTGTPTETLPDMSAAAPTERLPRVVAEEIAERAAQEQAARQKADDRAVRPDATGDAGMRATDTQEEASLGGMTWDGEALDVGELGDGFSATVLENIGDLPSEPSATNKEIVKALESSLDYHPERVDIQLKLLEIYHHEALDNRENFQSMLRKVADLKNLSPAQRLHVEMLQRTLQDGDSSLVAEEEISRSLAR